MSQPGLEHVTAHGTTLDIDRRRNRFVLHAPGCPPRTYPFMPTGLLVTMEQIRLAHEGLPPELVNGTVMEGGGRASNRWGTGMVSSGTIIGPGVAVATSRTVGGFFSHTHRYVLGPLGMVAIPTVDGDGYSDRNPVFDPTATEAVSPGGERILGRRPDGLDIFHVRDQRVVRIGTHRTREGDFAVDKEVRVVVTTISDGTVLVWDTVTGETIARAQVDARRLRSLEASPDAAVISWRGADRSWRWRWRTGADPESSDPA